jgi:tape measure domain-containing protein
MAVTVEELRAVLRLEMKPFMRDLQSLHGVNARAARQVEAAWQNTNRRLNGIGRGMATSLIAPLAGIAAAASVREVLDYADAWTTAQNKLNAAGEIAGRQARSLEEVNEIASRTRTSITATVDLYAKLLRATAGVADSELEVARATEIVNKAFKAGGAATSEQIAGILQLSQGLGSGILQGDELRSVRENAPLLAQAIADEFETTIAGLKDLGAQGEITSARVFRAILNAQPQIERAFASTNATISDGMTRVGNALTQYIGQSDQSLSASQRLVAGLNALADNFDQTADIVLKLAGVIAGALVGRSIAGMIRSLGVGTAALLTFVRAARTMGGLGVAMSGLGAAAGPVGLLIGGAVVTALLAFSSSSTDASASARTYADALEEVRASAEAAESAVSGATEAIDERGRNELEGGIAEGTAQIDAARDAVVAYIASIEEIANPRYVSEEQLQQLRDVRQGLDDNTMSAEDAEQAIFALANSDPNFQNLADQFGPLIGALMNAIAATDLLQGKLAGLGGGPSFREAENASMEAYGELAETNNEFVEGAERRNALTADQLALENEIASVRREADRAGALLTTGQVTELASANIAAGERRSAAGRSGSGGGGGGGGSARENELEREIEQIRERTEAFTQEAAAVGLSAIEAAKAEASFSLLNAAQEAGIAVTPELRGQIDELAGAYAAASVAADEAKAAQDNLNDVISEANGLAKDVLGGFISDLRSGKSAAEALAGALQKVGDKLIDIALNSLFPSSGGGGLLSSLLGSIFGGGGGIPQFAPIAGGMFDKGGYTGPGGKHKAAGIVHAGEYVFDQDAVRAAGGPAALDAMRRNLKGYANGGFVGSLPPVTGRTASKSAAAGPIAVTVDVSGARGSAEIEEAALRGAKAGADLAIKRMRGPEGVSVMGNAQQRFG